MNTCISECADRWDLALHLLSQMPSFGLVPDEFTYASCMAACARGGQFQMGLDIFADLMLGCR